MNIENKYDRKVRIFETPLVLAETFAYDLANEIRIAANRQSSFTVALAGGSTPRLLYTVLAGKYGKSVDWSIVHLFWGDERCVPPDDPDSNFGMAEKEFISKIDIPLKNIHRIRGEDDPVCEAERYSEEIIRYTGSLNGIPAFDQIILGMGEDGHTVSIFPENKQLLNSEKVCDVGVHPISGQKRITITGKVINSAHSIAFLVTGYSKARMIGQIFKKKTTVPASLIISMNGKTEWLLDKNAGEFL